MGNSRTITTIDETSSPAKTTWSDFTALIKIGIVNSNLITTFTGLWLAFMFTEKHFLQSLDIVILTLVGSAFIIAGSCALNNFIDRDIDPIMQRTKGRPTVTGKISGSKVLIIGFTLVDLNLLMLLLKNIVTGVIGIIDVVSYVVLYIIYSKRRQVSITIVVIISATLSPLQVGAGCEPTFLTMALML